MTRVQDARTIIPAMRLSTPTFLRSPRATSDSYVSKNGAGAAGAVSVGAGNGGAGGGGGWGGVGVGSCGSASFASFWGSPMPAFKWKL
jgi:hypothetical protein